MLPRPRPQGEGELSTTDGLARRARSRAAAVLLAGLAAATGCGPDPKAALAQLIEARDLAADLRVQLHRSAEEAQRAVMAESDEEAAAFAAEAEEATRALERDLASLVPTLERLRYTEERRLAGEFEQRFTELRELDRWLLALAVENTNAKAQRLAFGPAREAADAFCERLREVARSAKGASASSVALIATRAELAVREIQALQASHIAEAEDARMTQLEERMAASEASAR